MDHVEIDHINGDSSPRARRDRFPGELKKELKE
jgi:hypothetical protein